MLKNGAPPHELEDLYRLCSIEFYRFTAESINNIFRIKRIGKTNFPLL